MHVDNGKESALNLGAGVCQQILFICPKIAVLQVLGFSFSGLLGFCPALVSRAANVSPRLVHK
jgi:hypothetical protein